MTLVCLIKHTSLLAVVESVFALCVVLHDLNGVFRSPEGENRESLVA